MSNTRTIEVEMYVGEPDNTWHIETVTLEVSAQTLLSDDDLEEMAIDQLFKVRSRAGKTTSFVGIFYYNDHDLSPLDPEEEAIESEY